MNYTLLKKTRVALALLFFSFTLLSFVDIYEIIPEHIISNIIFLQFLPSLLKFIQITSLTAVGFLIVIVLTVIFGRIYCSTICPLGILQDIFTFFAKLKSKKKRFFKFKKASTKTRYSLLIISIISLLVGFSIVLSLLDPYSNAGRIFTYNIKPAIIWGNNLIANILQNQRIYSLHIIDFSQTPIVIAIYSFIFFIVIAYLSYKRGRLFCNLICPVGTLLGLISKRSVLKIGLNATNCTQCGKCASVCKSECIDIKNKEIDYSRCVLCFDCLPVCEYSAIDYTNKTKSAHKPDTSSTQQKKFSRRSAISTLLTLTASTSILSQNGHHQRHGKHLNSGHNREYQLSLRKNPVSPPGAKSIERFNNLCTACGLCISACPTQVLQPSIKEYGLIGFMQPHMDYAHAGFCNFDCNRCSEICPTGALLTLPIEEKQLTQLGKAVFVKENCVVHRDGTDCGACSEHCPTKAVNMVPYRDGLVIPQVNQDICIGCGACEHPCPVEYPYKAIYVEGNAIHQKAKKPATEENTYKTVEEDFPF
jgi:ferredoxin